MLKTNGARRSRRKSRRNVCHRRDRSARGSLIRRTFGARPSTASTRGRATTIRDVDGTRERIRDCCAYVRPAHARSPNRVHRWRASAPEEDPKPERARRPDPAEEGGRRPRGRFTQGSVAGSAPAASVCSRFEDGILRRPSPSRRRGDASRVPAGSAGRARTRRPTRGLPGAPFATEVRELLHHVSSNDTHRTRPPTDERRASRSSNASKNRVCLRDRTGVGSRFGGHRGRAPPGASAVGSAAPQPDPMRDGEPLDGRCTRRHPRLTPRAHPECPPTAAARRTARRGTKPRGLADRRGSGPVESAMRSRAVSPRTAARGVRPRRPSTSRAAPRSRGCCASRRSWPSRRARRARPAWRRSAPGCRGRRAAPRRRR